MPCTAKKFEAQRPEMNDSGVRDVDIVLTTRELGRMIKQAGIDFTTLPDDKMDAPLGLSTGAADIFAEETRHPARRRNRPGFAHCATKA